MSQPTPSLTAFQGHRRLAAGDPGAVVLAVRRADPADGVVLMFDDATGRAIDADLRGDEGEVVARFLEQLGLAASPASAPEARGRGRPRLGVVAREVTLLPRHWDWLATQPGGASVTLRRLVEAARRAGADQDQARRGRDAAYGVMSALAGDLAGFEEASRALFAGDRSRLEVQIAAWPADVRDHILALAYPASAGEDPRPTPPAERAAP